MQTVKYHFSFSTQSKEPITESQFIRLIKYQKNLDTLLINDSTISQQKRLALWAESQRTIKFLRNYGTYNG